MAYVITDACMSCEACELVCPTNCISKGEIQHEIDAELCIECGSCAEVCIVNAPKPE